MMVSKRNLLFQGLLCRFHVKFQGCNGVIGKKTSFNSYFNGPWVGYEKNIIFSEFRSGIWGQLHTSVGGKVQVGDPPPYR